MKRITEREFQAAVEDLPVGRQTLEIAHRVLVRGEKQADLARRLRLSKGAVSQAVKRVWLRNQQRLPAGYERVTVVLPAHRAFQVRKWAEEAERQLSRELLPSPAKKVEPASRR